MANPYLQVFNEAKAAYFNREVRPGYLRTCLSNFRHSTEKVNVGAKQLEELLQSTDNVETAKIAIEKYLKENTKEFNNHSFGSYFLDALIQRFPTEGWKTYDPKPTVYSEEVVYRGEVLRNYKNIFKHGFKELKSSVRIDDYLADATGTTGISTSKKFEVAREYALPRLLPRRFEESDYQYSELGYVYQIDAAKSKNGIDIDATMQQRKKFIRTCFSGIKMEVNFIGEIKPENIMGVFEVYRDGTRKWIENPRYKPSKSKESKDETEISQKAEKDVSVELASLPGCIPS